MKAGPDPFNLSGEVAVVLGATGTLGGAIAEGLAAAGASVAVLGRDRERGERCVGRIVSKRGIARFFAVDATDSVSLVSAHRAIREALGNPTVLVNGAGGNDPKVTVTGDLPFEKIAPADWRASFDVNLMGGALLPCQEFGPAMAVRGKGSIINIGSVSGHVPLSRAVAYSAAKAAVLNLTQFLAREWAPLGVRVNSLTPGFFPAEQNRALLSNEDGTPTARAKAILAHTAMGRFGEPSELVGAAIFLASSRASAFITGADLRVDGGFLAQTI